MNKRQLYESIMSKVAKEVKKALNEEFSRESYDKRGVIDRGDDFDPKMTSGWTEIFYTNYYNIKDDTIEKIDEHLEAVFKYFKSYLLQLAEVYACNNNEMHKIEKPWVSTTKLAERIVNAYQGNGAYNASWTYIQNHPDKIIEVVGFDRDFADFSRRYAEYVEDYKTLWQKYDEKPRIMFHNLDTDKSYPASYLYKMIIK